MDFTSAAWAASVGCWGSPLRVPLTQTSANPTTNQQKKPRQGSGAREIREIRTIRAMKPLQTIKGSTQSADHLRRLAGLDPLPQIAAEPEGGTDTKNWQWARHLMRTSEGDRKVGVAGRTGRVAVRIGQTVRVLMSFGAWVNYRVRPTTSLVVSRIIKSKNIRNRWCSGLAWMAGW